MQIIRPIPLNDGKIAIIDEADYELVRQYKWHCYDRYVICSPHGKERTTISMHRLIMKPPAGFVVDHINQNKLDNRRSNLRICTQSQNKANCFKSANNKSGIKGVSWNKSTRKWQTSIRNNRKHIFIGQFKDIHEASQAYAKKAREIFGEFACLE